MTIVEWSWFEKVFRGGPTAEPIPTDDDVDADFNDLDPGQAMARTSSRFGRQCEISRAIVAVADSLDVLAAAWNGAGDAALDHGAHDRGVRPAQRARRPLRELIDGAVGE